MNARATPDAYRFLHCMLLTVLLLCSFIRVRRRYERGGRGGIGRGHPGCRGGLPILGSGRKEPLPSCRARGLAAVADAELAEDRGNVVINGLHREEEPRRDLR